MSDMMIWVPVLGVVALVFSFWRTGWISKQDEGSEKMKAIGGHIADGAMAFLKAEYRVLGIFIIAVAILLAFANRGEGMRYLVAVSFIVGAMASGLAGFLGMRVATKANYRTAQAARTGLSQALEIAFAGGSVMGLSVVGLGVIGLGGIKTGVERAAGTARKDLKRALVAIAEMLMDIFQGTYLISAVRAPACAHEPKKNL